MLYLNNKLIDNSLYNIDYQKSILYVNDQSILNQKVKISYRVFPISFNQTYSHKKINAIENEEQVLKNPFLFEYVPVADNVFYLNGLSKSGSISRGVTFGNNQDLAVNSSLNLQLSGKVSNDVSILASISDDNIPIQAEGNTQQLQEFDNVFIQLYNDQWKLTAGDFFMEKPNSYFLNYNKKAKGGIFEIKLQPDKQDENKIIIPKLSAAIAKGKFARNQFNGIEGNQGPYRLRGNDNETFIIVLSGTEQVFVDGQLLKRGNEFDYVIDYNTAEITFTANFLITKDKRIVVTFDYSDRNYSRTIYNYSTHYESKKLSLDFNIYSEQDLKNQPLQQDLTDEQKLILANVGDSIENAVVPNYALVEFSENKVLYQMIDTLGYDSVFVYSTNPDSAIYQLGFSQVGQNKGNYVQVQSSANGKVYEWVAPIGGVPQGNYEPVILLVSPKKLQISTLGGEYKFSENSKLLWEGAVSNYDKNTFSAKDSYDNIGYAFKVKSLNSIPLTATEKSWQLNAGGGYEFVNKYFKFLGPFRNIEFNRDWNINNTLFTSDQHLGSVYLGIEKNKKASLNYQIDMLQNIDEYKGVKNNIFLNYNSKGFNAVGNGSFLYSEGAQNTRFFRNKLKLTQNIGWVVVGVEDEFEQNKFLQSFSDSLLANSYQFLMWRTFLQNADTTINKFVLSYQQRTDNSPLLNQLSPITFAEDIAFGYDWLKNKNHVLRTKLTYRKLKIIEPTISVVQPDENVLSRVEYIGKILKSAITFNTYYQIGSGLEVKREFSYAEVQPGQGTHAFLGDLNNNGVNDLNEFDVAVFQDQANFIKIFTPTNDYVRTYTNDFNQGLFLNPETNWGNSDGLKKVISRFSNRTNYRAARKLSDKADYYNPFVGSVDDSSLVTLNLGFLNTIYFNRTNTKWSADFTYQDNQDRSLLTNGKETRRFFTRTLKLRWNLTRILTFNTTLSNGVKNNKSQFFANQNYYLSIYEGEPKLIIQPNVKYRITLLYKYKEKLNGENFGGQELQAHKVGTEFRYNIATKGSLLFGINYIENRYNNTVNNESLNYEILEGLQQGSNTTWELVFQQNLSKHMQLNLNYNGRKSNNSKIIHIGGVQVRAFF